MKATDQRLGVKSEEIPLVFDCKFLARIMMCSESTARSIMHRPGFPVIELSAHKHVIYRAKFIKWLEEEAGEVL